MALGCVACLTSTAPAVTSAAAAMPAAAFEATVEMPAETAPPAVDPAAAAAVAPATPAPAAAPPPELAAALAPAPAPILATHSFFMKSSGPIG